MDLKQIEALKKENITADESLHDAGWNGAINEVLKTLKAGQHETIVMLRKSLKDEIERVADIVDDTKSEDRDNIYYRGIEVGLNKALSLLEMHKAT